MSNCCVLQGMVNFLTSIGNKLSYRRKPKTSIVLLVAGLDNAGKSAIVNYIFNKSLITEENVVSTMGFRTFTVNYKSCSIRLYDVGGSPQIRALWPKYYSDVHGVIYVVDSNDKERLSESVNTFQELVCDELISQKPILFLGNKQDLENAMNEVDLVDYMNIEHIVNFVKCYTRVEICSCYPDNRKHFNLNKNIDIGFKWLIDTIYEHYDDIKEIINRRNLKRNHRRRSYDLKSWAAPDVKNPFNYSDTDSEAYMKPIVPEDPTPKKRKKKKMFKCLFPVPNNKTAPMPNGYSDKLPTADTMRELIRNIRIEDLIKNNMVEMNVINEYRRSKRYWKKRPNTAPAVFRN